MTTKSPSPEWAEQYLYLVKDIAQGVRLPHCVEIEDLTQWGSVGLLEAAQQYEGPEKEFPKFARSWIRASMLQEEPAATVASPRHQRILRHIKQRSRELEQSLGRPARPVEHAVASGLTLEAYQTLLSERYAIRAQLSGADSNQGRALREAAAGDPLQAALQRCATRSLKRACRKLSGRERRMLKMHYGEGLKLKTIGLSFDVSESRVCQILGRALALLRAELS